MPSRRVIVVTTTIAYLVWKKDRLRPWLSALCEFFSETPLIEADVARDQFAELIVTEASRSPGHTHANAAALRSSATNTACSFAARVGIDMFSIGMSKSDQRKGLRGSRQWFWAKDVHTENRLATPGPEDVLYICDVDYYIDMPHLLGVHLNPVILYTCVPERATSTKDDDTSFTFDESGRLDTRVAGGGHYLHHLWDYGGDSVTATKTFFGIPYSMTCYAIERKQIGKHRQAILLAPIKRFSGVGALIASYLIGGQPLKQFDPITVASDGTKFVRFYVHTSDGLSITTARPMDYASALVTAEIDNCIAAISRLGTTKLQIPSVASWETDRVSAAILAEYHRVASPCEHPWVFPVKLGVRAYSFNIKEYDQEAKTKLSSFMAPLIHGAFAPVNDVYSERQCVKGRIDDLKKPEPKPHRFRDACMEEFAELILNGEFLEPVSVEAVEHKQTGAAQKQSLWRAYVHGPIRKRILKCFLKAEAYQDVKDPRNISVYNDADKLEMSCFALALSEHCKKFRWYGPGKTPREIAMRVAAICLNARFVNISDYHRMDGTISGTIRVLDRVICMKAFINHRAVLNELLKSNYGNVGRLPGGTTFNQGTSHGSGCPATSLFQTLRAAFTAFLGFRRTDNLRTGNKYTAKEAFDALGLHLGDDGIDADLPIDSHKWAAERVGLILEAATVERYDRGVNFLARYYSPFVWEGGLDSMSDIKRQLSKFHTTVNLPAGIPPIHKLVEKAMAYIATDRNTPIIGDLCKRVLQVCEYRPKSLLGIGSWWSRYDESVQYPNENVGGWMDVELGIQLPEFDVSIFVSWLDSADTTEKLLSPPLCTPIRAANPKVSVVVDGETHLLETPSAGTSDSGREFTKRENRGNSTHPHRRNDQPKRTRKLGVTLKLKSGEVRELAPTEERRSGW